MLFSAGKSLLNAPKPDPIRLIRRRRSPSNQCCHYWAELDQRPSWRKSTNEKDDLKKYSRRPGEKFVNGYSLEDAIEAAWQPSLSQGQVNFTQPRTQSQQNLSIVRLKNLHICTVALPPLLRTLIRLNRSPATALISAQRFCAPDNAIIIKPHANLENTAFWPFFAVYCLWMAPMNKYSCTGTNTLVERSPPSAAGFNLHRMPTNIARHYLNRA